MATYQKNIRYLKKSVYETLNGDVTLLGLIGASGRIYHLEPPQMVQYPCVVYQVLDDRDNVYNETLTGGEVTRSNIRITVYSNESTTQQSDNIEARVKELLHGQRTLDSDEIICYSCLRDTLVEPMKDFESQVWITAARYRVTWATK